MNDVWTVQVAGQSYGPYPLDRMKEFIAEGRVVAKSLVAYGSDTQFHHAGDDLILGPLLPPEQVEQPAHSEPVHEAPIVAESTAQVSAAQPSTQSFSRTVTEPGIAHVIIMTDLKSRSENAIEDAIYALGPAFPVLPQVWLVMTRESVNNIRKMLSTRLGSVDALFVVDTTNDGAAWFNFPPEKEARIRRVWENTEAVPRSAA